MPYLAEKKGGPYQVQRLSFYKEREGGFASVLSEGGGEERRRGDVLLSA